MVSFVVRRLATGAGVVLVVSYATFVLMATHFSSTCTSSYTPIGLIAPPLAATSGSASRLFLHWLAGIPTGRSLAGVCNGQSFEHQLIPAFFHTFALLAATALVVISASTTFGVFAAWRRGSVIDTTLRTFTYMAWAVPSFVLALVLQSGFSSLAKRHYVGWLTREGWPGSCIGQGGIVYQCGSADDAWHHLIAVISCLVLPTVALSLAFIGIHTRYLRSSMIAALAATYTNTARAKGLPERTVVLRHALRNSSATFISGLLLDFGAIFGAAMAVDWVFRLNGLGSLLISELAGLGSGDSPRYLNPYGVEMLLASAAVLVVVSSILADLAVAWLDPRTEP